MTKIKIFLLAAIVFIFAASAAYAANIGGSAEIPNSSPDLTLVIKELNQENQDPWSGTTVTNMNFGALSHMGTDGKDTGVWYSSKYYCVFILTSSYGHKYEVRSTCAGVTNGTTTLPVGSFGLVPGYSEGDEWSAGNAQGAMPSGAVLGAAGSAVATNKVIYNSEAAGSNRIIRAFYSLPSYKAGNVDPFPGYEPIRLDQSTGAYSTTVTITIAAI